MLQTEQGNDIEMLTWIYSVLEMMKVRLKFIYYCQGGLQLSLNFAFEKSPKCDHAIKLKHLYSCSHFPELKVKVNLRFLAPSFGIAEIAKR